MFQEHFFCDYHKTRSKCPLCGCERKTQDKLLLILIYILLVIIVNTHTYLFSIFLNILLKCVMVVMKSVSVSHLVSGSYVDTLIDSVKAVPI